MELSCLLNNTVLCRLCGEDNRFGTDLFESEENKQNLCELVNKYLPLKVENDDRFPKKICPGCNIQLEATKSFMDLIIEGQNKLRQWYKAQQEKLNRQERQRVQLEEALKTVNPNSSVDTYTIQSDETGEKFLIQIFSQGPLFPPDHELALRAEGLEKPRRRRGRPSKASQAAKESETAPPIQESIPEEPTEETSDDGKRRRRRKVPNRYSEALQGKELDKVFKQEGVIDEESSGGEGEGELDDGEGKKVEEIIGRLENAQGEDLGQPVVINKTLGRTKVKNRNTIQAKKRRRYRCEICHKEFLHHGRYEVHKKSHQVEFVCKEPFCEFKTENKLDLEQHQSETGHSETSAVENIDEYGVMELSADQSAPGTPTEDTEEETRQKKPFFCDKCSKQFSCKQNYQVHLKAVHQGERPFACPTCNKRFSYANSLRIHQLQHNRSKNDNDPDSGQYRCPSCPKAFRHPSSLQYHRDSEHTNGRRFVCNKCDKPFKHRQLLQRHQLVHSDERPHRCLQCASAFKTRANLLHHTRTVHVGQRSHWCSQCGKAFAHKTALKLHQRWHSGLRPYQCDFCQKSFSQKGNLAEHRRIHTGEKPYQCDFCGRAFTTSSQFRLHRKRHLDERPHRCEYCPKSFLHKVTLKCHTRRHFDLRPFRCLQCPKTFPEAWALKKHERLHTGEKPYKCEICTKAFADSSNLAKHRRTHKKPESKSRVVYVTYDKDENLKETVLQYIDTQDSLLESTEIINVTENLDEIHSVELQQLVDTDGNPISFTTQDGQQVKVVTSTEDDQENIQGLLPDGTLVPLNLANIGEKKIQLEDSLQKLDDVQLEGALLDSNIQFLTEDEAKLHNNIQFITEDNQNMCLVTTYNIEDTINPQYLTMS